MEFVTWMVEVFGIRAEVSATRVLLRSELAVRNAAATLDGKGGDDVRW